VPPNDVKKKNKTHYHKKDIMFLMHDPIIMQIRKYKTFRRKLRKARPSVVRAMRGADALSFL
jgi:hypothetical protein